MVNVMSGVEINLRAAQPPNASSGQGDSRIVRAAPAEPKSLPTVSVKKLNSEATARRNDVAEQMTKTISDIKSAVETLNSTMKKIPTTLAFSVDAASNRMVVQVTNEETGEVVRTLPGEAVLQIARNLESLKGVLFDEAF
jgi:flagellar protein FlaG